MATVEQRTRRVIVVYRELARADDSVNAVMERQLRKIGIGIAQFRIMDRLLHAGPTPQMELAEILLLSKSNISRVLERLVTKSLVARCEGLFPKQARVIRAHMSALNEREQETSRKLCQKLSAGNAQRYIAELTEEE
ncbi:MAG TPA: MarR family transcriptional regulator [Candidatus Acidoferrales bacterium]